MILMLVEDHLRLQSKQNCAASAVDVSPSPLSLVYPPNYRSHTLPTVGESSEVSSSRASVSSDSGGVHLDVSRNYSQPLSFGILFVHNLICPCFSYLRINLSPSVLAYFFFVYITSFKKYNSAHLINFLLFSCFYCFFRYLLQWQMQVARFLQP